MNIFLRIIKTLKVSTYSKLIEVMKEWKIWVVQKLNKIIKSISIVCGLKLFEYFCWDYMAKQILGINAFLFQDFIPISFYQCFYNCYYKHHTHEYAQYIWGLNYMKNGFSFVEVSYL